MIVLCIECEVIKVRTCGRLMLQTLTKFVGTLHPFFLSMCVYFMPSLPNQHLIIIKNIIIIIIIIIIK